MEYNSKRQILLDVIDGIPPSNNETDENLIFRKNIENNNLSLEKEAMKLGLGKGIIEFNEDFR
tara:strand:+ start:581 stop:769 length:189 start_codon:yes stop_codon:yes gene_type:complete